MSHRREEIPVRCGQVVRLLHSEHDVFLETTPRVELFGPDHSDSIVVLEPSMGFGQPDHDMGHHRKVSYVLLVVGGSWGPVVSSSL